MVGVWVRPSARLTSGVMAFGAGALLAAMSFELVLPALEREHFRAMAVGLILGCVAFVTLNHVLNGQGAFLRKAATLAEYARGVKRRKVEEALEELSRVDILRSLPPEEAQALVPYVGYGTLPAGEIVFDQGDPGDALYIIEEDRVAVMRTERGRGAPWEGGDVRRDGPAHGANPGRFSFFEGLAAGAIVSMIAQAMLPEAFEDGGGPAVAMLTVAGFLAGTLLGIITG